MFRIIHLRQLPGNPEKVAWGNLLAGHLLVSFSCGHLLVGSITWPKLLVDICLLGQILVGHLLVGKCLWTFTCRTFPCRTFTCNHHFAQGNIRTTALPGKLKWEKNIQLRLLRERPCPELRNEPPLDSLDPQSPNPFMASPSPDLIQRLAIKGFRD